MNTYRHEIRIFGLLSFALVSTLLLNYGLKTGDVQGEMLGVSFRIIGTSAFFLVQLVMFGAFRLFGSGLKGKGTELEFNRPVESLTLAEIDDLLDEVLKQLRRTNRQKVQLEAAKAAAENQASPVDVMAAAGFRPARRTGAA